MMTNIMIFYILNVSVCHLPNKIFSTSLFFIHSFQHFHCIETKIIILEILHSVGENYISENLRTIQHLDKSFQAPQLNIQTWLQKFFNIN